VTSSLPILEAAAKVQSRVDGINLKYNSTLEDVNATKYEPDQVPYSEGLVFKHATIEFLFCHKLPSFRAVMVHKMNVIKRAYGGTISAAAYQMVVPRRKFTGWIQCEFLPKNWSELQKIDSHYETALELLAMEARREAGKQNQKKKK
jgi:hypothetical protein